MTNIAVLYGTTEGQTAKIAQHIGARVREAGYRVDVHHLADLNPDFDLRNYAGVISGASVHEGHHQRYVMKWMKDHRDALSRVPTAWFSVCLAINSSNENERDEARAFPDQVPEHTGLTPTMSTVFAGALKYTQYNWLKRIVMKQISKKEGGSTDTAHDHEYTDWSAVDAFTDAFLAHVRA